MDQSFASYGAKSKCNLALDINLIKQQQYYPSSGSSAIFTFIFNEFYNPAVNFINGLN